MQENSTALIALNSLLTNQNLSKQLLNLKTYTTNKSPINTKESIIPEVELLKPNFLFVSSSLPGIIKLEEVISKIKEVSQKTKIILIASDNDSDKILSWLVYNVDAILWADSLNDSLEFALKQLAKGQPFICSKTTLQIKLSLANQKQETKFDHGLLQLLTDREGEVLNYLTQGVNYKQISKILFISESTVKTHINNIFTKLNVNDRTQAVLYALKHGIENIIKKPHTVQNLLNESVPR